MRIITVARKINTYSDGEVVGKSSMTHEHKRKTEIKKHTNYVPLYQSLLNTQK